MEWYASSDGGPCLPPAQKLSGLRTIDESAVMNDIDQADRTRRKQLLTYEPLPDRRTSSSECDQVIVAGASSGTPDAMASGQEEHCSKRRGNPRTMESSHLVDASLRKTDTGPSNSSEGEQIKPFPSAGAPRSNASSTPPEVSSSSGSGPFKFEGAEEIVGTDEMNPHDWDRDQDQVKNAGVAGSSMIKIDGWLKRALKLEAPAPGGDQSQMRSPGQRMSLPLSPSPSGSPGSLTSAEPIMTTSPLEYSTFSALASSVDSIADNAPPTETYFHPPTPILSPSTRSMIGIDSIAMLSMTSSTPTLSPILMNKMDEGGSKYKARPSLSLSRSLPMLPIENLILTDGVTAIGGKPDVKRDKMDLERQSNVKGSSSVSSSTVNASRIIAPSPSRSSTSSSNITRAINASNLFTPYTTLIRTATVPVGHFTSRPSRIVVQTRTERSSPHNSMFLNSAEADGQAGKVGAQTEAQRTRENTAEGKPVGLGVGLSAEMEGFGIGLALHSWNGGWRGGTQSEADMGGVNAAGTAPLTRTLSSHGHKRQRVRLKRADELVDWSDPGYRVASPRSSSAPYDRSPLSEVGDLAWATAPSSPAQDSWDGYQPEEQSESVKADGWTSFGTQDMWDESQSKKYEDRFGEGNVEKDLQGALDDLQKRGKYSQNAAQTSEPQFGIAVNVSDHDEHPVVSSKSETYPSHTDYGEDDDQWEDEDEGEIFVYGESQGSWNATSTSVIAESNEQEAGMEGLTKPTEDLQVQLGFRSPPPPPSPQLNNSPERTWSGALGSHVAADIKKGSSDLQQIKRPLQPQFPASLGRTSPFRHIVHLAAVALDIYPEELVDHSTFPRLTRVCGIDLDLAKVLISSELEFQPLIGMHQTRHEIYTYYKQTFRNKEAVAGTFQMLVLGLIQLATGRPVGETAATTLQSLMADMDIICLDFAGVCLEHQDISHDELEGTGLPETQTKSDSTEIDSAERQDIADSIEHALRSPITLSEETCDIRLGHIIDTKDQEEQCHDEICTRTFDSIDQAELGDSRLQSNPAVDKGKGKMQYPDGDEIPGGGMDDSDEGVDMEVESAPDPVEGELFDVPELVPDVPETCLFFGMSMWSVGARVIGMLSNKAGCPADHVLDMEEVAISLERCPGMSPQRFQEVLDEMMQQDMLTDEQLPHGQWYNFGDQRGIWRACRLRDALKQLETEFGGFQDWMFGIIALLQLYFDWEVGHQVESFWHRLGNEQVRYNHLPFVPSTPSTFINSPPTQHYPDPYLADISVQDRLEELERVARLQIGPSTKQW